MDKSDYLWQDSVLRDDDWENAYNAQDGVNLSGIVYSWAETLPRIWNEARDREMGTKWVNEHPINVLYADKVGQLAGLHHSQDNVSNAYAVLHQKVKVNA